MLPTLNQITALVSVVLIDIVLAGDNAIVVGMAAAGLPPKSRRRAILIGIAAATVLRIAFAAIALQLLEIIGLSAGRRDIAVVGGVEVLPGIARNPGGAGPRQRGDEPRRRGRKNHGESGDADRRRRHIRCRSTMCWPWRGWRGPRPNRGCCCLILSVALMGVASTLVARLLTRHFWLSWLGLAVIAGVALKMIWAGGGEVLGHLGVV